MVVRPAFKNEQLSRKCTKGAARMQPTQQAMPEDIPGQVQKLSALKDQGILTEQEFQQKKQELLSKM
jgi:hypothetical protein